MEKCVKCDNPIKKDFVLWNNGASCYAPDYTMCTSCWNSLPEGEKEAIYYKAYDKPQIYQNNKTERYYPYREQFVHCIMEYLNDIENYNDKVYDCNELGILHIWWRKGTWEWKWLKSEPLPGAIKPCTKEK